jgi:hypothetical protein
MARLGAAPDVIVLTPVPPGASRPTESGSVSRTRAAGIPR